MYYMKSFLVIRSWMVIYCYEDIQQSVTTNDKK